VASSAPAAAATALAEYLPEVLALDIPAAADHAAAAAAAPSLAALVERERRRTCCSGRRPTVATWPGR